MRLTWILDARIAASGMIGRADLLDLKKLGIGSIVSLTLRSPFAGEKPQGIDHLHLPVPDMSCPHQEVLVRAVAFLRKSVEAGNAALVHCGAGYGRTGTVIACYLVTEGLSAQEAMDVVRAARPGSIETLEQEVGIMEFALWKEGGR